LGQEETKLAGPDFAQGIPSESLADGQMLVGHAYGKAVLLARVGQEVFAVAPHCTHYNGPLAEGLVVDETVRCPWHHACFDLRTGEAVRAPALSPITCWVVVRNGGLIKVGEKREQPQPRTRIEPTAKPERIVIVGGGAAGFAAAEMLRRVGYARSLVMLSSDSALPYDRPNLSKDYLAGTIPFDYVPLRDESFYEENGIETQLGKTVVQLDVRAHELVLSSGERVTMTNCCSRRGLNRYG
jgi:nitrite reductase/ring-hydroxylating ferredoxin subunit